jgi:hypothetical protein
MPNRDDDIERIEALLRKPTDPHRAGKIIFVLAVLVIIGIPVYWYISSRPHSVEELSIKKIGANSYEVTLKNGGWYDTGLWVRSGCMVQALATVQGGNIGDEPQPFVLAVDHTEDKSVLIKGGAFLAQIHTTDDSNLKDENTAVVNNQGKIYLRVAPESSRNTVKMVVQILDEPSVSVGENKTEDTSKKETDGVPASEDKAGQSVPNKEHHYVRWGLIGLGGVVVLFFLVVIIRGGVATYFKKSNPRLKTKEKARKEHLKRYNEEIKQRGLRSKSKL